MWIGYSHADSIITYPYAHNLSASMPSEANSRLSQNSGQNPVENCGGVRCRDRPELQVRTCGGIHECTSGEKPPQTAVID